jgi:hypothetical protein
MKLGQYILQMHVIFSLKTVFIPSTFQNTEEPNIQNNGKGTGKVVPVLH